MSHPDETATWALKRDAARGVEPLLAQHAALRRPSGLGHRIDGIAPKLRPEDG